MPKSGLSAVASVGSARSPAYNVVAQYVFRDARGDRLQSAPWLDSTIKEPDHEPGYDSFTVIADCTLRSRSIHADSVIIDVTYNVIGRSKAFTDAAGAGRFIIVPVDTVETVAFPVVRTAVGWRIESPQIDQHVSPIALLYHVTVKPMLMADIQRMRR